MSRFKTELCNNLIELGICKYGDRCHYAHGAHELRQVSRRHPKYRTERCKNYELTGKCPFGPRCSYVHPKPDYDSMIEQLTKYCPVLNANDEANKENHFVGENPTSSSKPSILTTSQRLVNESNKILSSDIFFINDSHPTKASILQPPVASNQINHQALKTQPSQQTQPRVAMRAISTNHQLQQEVELNHKHLPASSSSLNILKPSESNPFGISNPLSDYFNRSSDAHVSTDYINNDVDQTEYPEVGVKSLSRKICSLLSNILSDNQIRMCLKHEDLLATVLPQVIQTTQRECRRITTDLRWNCTSVAPFLDRTNFLSYSKEGALIRSLLNASMMNLILKECEDHNHRTCGCQRQYSDNLSRSSDTVIGMATEGVQSNSLVDLNASSFKFNSVDLKTLDAGSPIRLTRSMARNQGCLANIAFADALTKMFIDLDDMRALDKAYRILNENSKDRRHHTRSSYGRRSIDSDHRDLSFIKWTKSAVNLHNNHLGRQLVRKATQRHCRCHGLSGMCQFQTCWDQIYDINKISSELKAIYLYESTLVEARNLGSYDRPDLCLAQSSSSIDYIKLGNTRRINTENSPNLGVPNIVRVKSDVIIYLYDSPDYCDSHPGIEHRGTKGRLCIPSNQTDVSTLNRPSSDDTFKRITENLNTCDLLCCNRGYYSELVFDMVTCNCRFKFCCKVDCGHCLLQRKLHYCL